MDSGRTDDRTATGSGVPDLGPWLSNRETIRYFDSDADLPESEVREIIDAGRKAPTSGNNQLYSFVWVRDPDVRAEIHVLCERASPQVEEAHHFLLVCIDIHRIRRLLDHRDREFMLSPAMALLEGAVDASLAAQNATTVAESRGYGVCPIGNILTNVAAISELVDAPSGVLPIFGLAIGVPHPTERSTTRPRLPLDAVLHDGTYTEPSPEQLERCYDAIDPMYDGTDRTWDGKLFNYWGPDGFMNDREPELVAALAQQGFFEFRDPAEYTGEYQAPDEGE